MAMINYADKVALNSNSGIADINKVNATDMNEIKNAFNNQVAQGWYKTGINPTFTFVSYDSETLTGVVSSDLDMTPYLNVGMKVKFTQNGVVKYGFITAITSSEITLFMGTDYILEDIAISNTYYSMLKAPFGFPLNPDKWTIKYSATALTIVPDPVSGQWYNLATLNLPIGLWDVTYNATIATTANGTSPNRCYITIGQNSNSEGSAGCMTGMNTGAANGISLAPATNNQLFDLTNAGTIYLTFMTNQPATAMVDVYAYGTATTIKAVCGYL